MQSHHDRNQAVDKILYIEDGFMRAFLFYFTLIHFFILFHSFMLGEASL